MICLKVYRGSDYSFDLNENTFNKIDEIIRGKIKPDRYKISGTGNINYKAEVFFDENDIDRCRLLTIELVMNISHDSNSLHYLVNVFYPFHMKFKGVEIEIIHIPNIRNMKFEIAIQFKKPISVAVINDTDGIYAITNRISLMINNYFTDKNELANYIKDKIYNSLSKIDGCYDHFYYNNEIVSRVMYEFGRDDSPQLIDIRKDVIDSDSNIDHATIRIFEC